MDDFGPRADTTFTFYGGLGKVIFNFKRRYSTMYTKGRVMPVHVLADNIIFYNLSHNNVSLQIEKRFIAHYRPCCKLWQHDVQC